MCVGLDPYPEKIDLVADDVYDFNRAIIDTTHEYVCAFKPNTSFYEGLGWKKGISVLKKTVEYIREVAPEVVIIGDGKRGDFGPAISRYPKLVFEELELDTAIINPYMGIDSVEPFLSYKDQEKGVFLLCRTSNPSSGAIQDLVVSESEGAESKRLYEHVAQLANKWNSESLNKNMGLVVGATYPEQLGKVRSICPDMPILIPGLGAQHGDLEASVRNGTDSEGRMAVFASSRDILYASKGQDFAEVAGQKARELRKRINDVLFLEEKGWHLT